MNRLYKEGLEIVLNKLENILYANIGERISVCRYCYEIECECGKEEYWPIEIVIKYLRQKL